MNAVVEKKMVADFAEVVPAFVVVKKVEKEVFVECDDLKARSQQAKKNRYKRRCY